MINNFEGQKEEGEEQIDYMKDSFAGIGEGNSSDED